MIDAAAGAPVRDDRDARIEAIALRHVTDFWDGGDRTITDALFDPGFVDHCAAPGQANDLTAFIQLADDIKTAFPDHRHEIHMTAVAGDWMTMHWTFHGTQLGVAYGFAPTGRVIKFRGTDFIRFRDFKMTEIYHVEDLASLFEQLQA